MKKYKLIKMNQIEFRDVPPPSSPPPPLPLGYRPLPKPPNTRPATAPPITPILNIPNFTTVYATLDNIIKTLTNNYPDIDKIIVEYKKEKPEPTSDIIQKIIYKIGLIKTIKFKNPVISLEQIDSTKIYSLIEKINDTFNIEIFNTIVKKINLMDRFTPKINQIAVLLQGNVLHPDYYNQLNDLIQLTKERYVAYVNNAKDKRVYVEKGSSGAKPKSLVLPIDWAELFMEVLDLLNKFDAQFDQNSKYFLGDDANILKCNSCNKFIKEKDQSNYELCCKPPCTNEKSLLKSYPSCSYKLKKK